MSVRTAFRAMVMCALSGAVAAHAYLDFYGYREVRKNYKSDSTHFVQQRLGSCQLVTSEVRVEPRGAYLDVVEDAWISGNVSATQVAGLADGYVLKGTIPVPENAVVTGVQTWTYATMYRATLKPRKYSYDQIYPDSARLQRALDARIILLQKTTDRAYELTLSRVALGEHKHVRIRYLLPNKGGARARYTIPVLFHTRYGSVPKYTKLTVVAADGNGYEIVTSSGAIALEDTSTTMVPYAPSIAFRSINPIMSSIQRTSFLTGEWEGTYQLLNTTLTDTMIQMLSRKIEVVFLWRWNGPGDLVTYRSGLKAISDDGRTVIDQAKALRTLAEELGMRGHRTGLVHSTEGGGVRKVALERVIDTAKGPLKKYLDGFNEHDIYDEYSSQPAPEMPSWVPTESSGSTAYAGGRDEFVKALTTATALFSDSDHMLKHIVVVTVGTVPATFDVLTEDLVDSLLGEATCDVAGAAWRGVNLRTLCPSAAEQGLTAWHGHYFPGFEPSTVRLTVSNAGQFYTFPLSVASSRDFSVIAKTGAEWRARLLWSGYDHLGQITDTVVTRPHIFDYPADSGLAKLWAGDGSHLAEQEEILVGQKYGIVTKATYLQATIDNVSLDDSRGVPYLGDQEIEYPIAAAPATRGRTRNAFSFTCREGVLALTAPDGETFGTLEIRDVRGRLLLRIDLRRYHRAGRYTVPLARLLKGLPSQTLVMTVRGSRKSYTAKLTTGGVK